MPLVFVDSVQANSTTTGTGTLTLGSATTGHLAWSVLSNGDTAGYRIENSDKSEWEVGIGTYATSGTTLARTTVIKSSNSNNAVNFSSGTKTVSLVAPAVVFSLLQSA